jgi:aldose 1-epimerase
MTLTSGDELRIDYTATTDRATPVNLTNHSYFNLAGGGNVLGHELKVAAKAYIPVDATSIPTGKQVPVAGTAFDFTKRKPIGRDFARLTGKPIGYDHNFVLKGQGQRLKSCGTVYERTTGRVMEVRTTEPGVQVYTGNWLDGTQCGHGGIYYTQHSGLCLETQHFPDSLHHPRFPSIILRPGQTYTQTTTYKFTTR